MPNHFANHPVLLIIHHKVFWVEDKCINLSPLQANQYIISGKTPLLCHRNSLYNQLKIDEAFSLPCLDILEWLSFLYPTLVAPPNIVGISKYFNLEYSPNPQQQAILLRKIAESIQTKLTSRDDYFDLAQLASKMGQGGWEWAQYLPFKQSKDPSTNKNTTNISAFQLWQNLPEWQSNPLLPADSQLPLEKNEITEKLEKIINQRNHDLRPAQTEYSHAIGHIFQPIIDDAFPHAALLEAYTGTGKTLGYLVPSQLYAHKNNATIWISTYTRNLQHQIYHEATDLTAKIAIRKGRENYLCLLNYQQWVERYTASPERFLVGLGLVARWISETQLGDLHGDDFPPWLEDLFSYRLISRLADRRNGCIHNLCPHFKICFIENSKATARQADIVIVNHALSLNEAENGNLKHNPKIFHMIFDEAHHLFQATDSFYAKLLSGNEAFQLRFWLDDGNSQNFKPAYSNRQYRGLWARLGKFVDQPKIAVLLQDIMMKITFLPQDHWCERVLAQRPQGASEIFFSELNSYVVVYNRNADPYYNLEAPLIPIPNSLAEAAHHLTLAISQLLFPLSALSKDLQEAVKPNDDNATLEKNEILQLERVAGRVELFVDTLTCWQEMLQDLAQQHKPDNIVDWLCVKRQQGVSYDFEFARHYIDPMQVFSDKLLQKLHGFAMTSATLFAHDTIANDSLARIMQGISEFPAPLIKKFHSEFDYAEQTKIFIATDIKTQQRNLLSNAYLQLFLAAGGGSLGIFTAVRRLKEVYHDIADQLISKNINLYAQHVDQYSVASLIKIFKNEENACLLGTDSLRDGIDVPGYGLRQVILEKMPWPRPDILTTTRRTYFGAAYYERLVRFRLKQAFGRLIRHKGDRGVFVLLDSAFPSKMKDAFPENIRIIRAPFAQIQKDVKEFLQ